MKLESWRRPLGALGGLTVLVLLLWWAFFRTVETVETLEVRRGSIENAVTALGVLQPQRYVDVGAQVSGQIKRIAVRPGDKVSKGDLLVEIDPAIQQAKVQTDRASLASLRAKLAEQEAELDFARQQAERQTALQADGATKAEDVQSAQSQLRVTQARIASLKAQIDGAQSTLQGNEALLGYTRIYATMDGTVVTLDAREGQTLNATYQTPNLLRIADLSRMTVWTEVSEADVGRISPEMPVYFTTLGLQDDAGQPRRWEGKLRQVLPAPPAAANAPAAGQNAAPAGKVVLYTALFDVDNADGALMPQMSAQVFFVLGSARNALLAPMAALAAVDGQKALFLAKVLVDREIQERSVRIGVRDRLNGEVLESLNEGDKLVTGIKQVKASTRLRW